MLWARKREGEVRRASVQVGWRDVSQGTHEPDAGELEGTTKGGLLRTQHTPSSDNIFI